MKAVFPQTDKEKQRMSSVRAYDEAIRFAQALRDRGVLDITIPGER